MPCCCPSDGDAVVEVPGYDVRVIPTSGVLQTAIYWAIAGGMAGAAQPDGCGRPGESEGEVDGRR